MKDDKTRTSSSSQTEEDEAETATVDHEATLEFNTIFWDIEAVKDLPIWAEPITTLTDRLFGAFDLAADEDILVPLGAIDGILPGRTKYECDHLRSTIELVYKTPTDCRWDDLGSAIRKFTAHEVSKKDLVKYTGPQLVHGIECNLLLETSQAVVSVDQILQVLADFFNKRQRERFILDYDFAFL